MLKKNDWHETVWQPVVNLDKNHERSGRPDKNRDTYHELKRGSTGRQSSDARQLGCVFQDMKPPKSILRKGTDMPNAPSNPSQNSFMQQNERKSSRIRSPRGRSPSGRTSRWPCKDYLRGTCNNSFCERWHPPECLFYKDKNGCRFGEKCSFAHRQVDEQPTKRSKKNDDKSAVAM